MRAATPDDYETFVRFFRELGVEDPVPTRDAWLATMAPRTMFLERDGRDVGYALLDVLDGTGYVRHVVVDPSARRSGVGRALMDAIAARLRERGCTSWCLNVKRGNTAALALYARVGMEMAYESVAFHFEWERATKLPRAMRAVDASEVRPDEDAEIETRFALLRGMLASFRNMSGQLLVVLRDHDSRDVVGFSRFAPGFPGSFPFRVASVDLASALLDALRPHALPKHDWLMLTVEDDVGLASALEATGARVTMRLLHLRGSLG